LASGDNPEHRQKEWSCENCSEQKGERLQLQRNCPYLDKDEKKEIKEIVTKSSLSKYDIKLAKKKAKRNKERLDNDEKRRPILEIGSHKFYSCPAGLLIGNRGLIALIDLINWSENMNTPLFDGGLTNHTQYYFECYRTVIGEQKAIENEEMKRNRKETEKKSKKPKSPHRKPTIKSGRRRR